MTDWEAFRQALPERAPAALKSWAENTLRDELGGEFLIFRRESTRWSADMWDEFLARVPKKTTWCARCTCTACNEDFVAGHLSPTREGVGGIRMILGEDGAVYTGVPEDEINSIPIAETDHIDCPLCGEDVQVLSKRALGGGRTYQAKVVTVENVHGVTTLLYWMAHRRVYSEGYAALDIWPQEAIALTERGALKRFSRAWYGQFGHTGESKEWRASNSRRDPETILYYSWEASSHRKLGSWVYPEAPDLTGTTGEKTGLEDYLRAGGGWPGQYLRLWKQHRNIENLARAGWGRTLGDAIDEMVQNRVRQPYRSSEIELRWINWDETRPSRMLGMSKAEVRTLAGQWDWRTADEWAVYRYWRGDCTAEEFSACRAALGEHGLQRIVQMNEEGIDAPLVKTTRYIKRQEERRGGDLTGIYADYREMLDADAPAEEIWPRDLVAAHDRLAAIQGDAEARQYTATMREMAQELEGLRWSDGEICIRAAATPGELKEEGRVLKHCVGTYCGKHAKRTDVIFFVRHARRPERSWYTLDIQMTGRIPKEVQLHG